MRKQETIEEVYLNELIDNANKEFILDRKLAKEVAIKYFKWQQQQNNNLYSEEDMRDYASYILLYDAISPKKWFEQFKKKQ
jgi:hypothetical protein